MCEKAASSFMRLVVLASFENDGVELFFDHTVEAPGQVYGSISMPLVSKDFMAVAHRTCFHSIGLILS